MQLTIGKEKVKQAVQATQPAANQNEYDPEGKFDAVCDIFPMMEKIAYEELKESIRKNGQREPITMQNGRIIDGRHRYQACMELGIAPKVQELDPHQSAIRYCVDKNLHRRHLTDYQKVEVAIRIGMLSQGSNQHTAGAGRSQAVLSELVGASPDTLQRGRKIFRDGSEELKKAARSGKIAVSVGATLSSLPKEKQDEILKKGVDSVTKMAAAINSAKMEEKRAEKTRLINELAANNPTFAGLPRSSVIYADPPWDYLGLVGTPYPTMKIDKICALPVADIVTEDATLFMWVTSAMVSCAQQVIEAWGFEYKTCAVWDKQKAGQGQYFRQQHELLFVATRGKPPTVDLKKNHASVIRAPRGRHSEKPDIVYEIIEDMYPELGKAELFSRNQREGWVMWGNQVGFNDFSQ